jgi:hypothetical protein
MTRVRLARGCGVRRAHLCDELEKLGAPVLEVVAQRRLCPSRAGGTIASLTPDPTAAG